MLEDSIAGPEDLVPNAQDVDPPTDGPSCRGVVIAPCPPEDRVEGLEVLYRAFSAATRVGMIVELLRQEEGGAIDLSGLWVALRRRRIVGAMLTQELAGRAVAIWPPVVQRAWRGGTLASAMVTEALAWYRGRGVVLAQALVDQNLPKSTGEELARGGLPYATDLIYLGRPTGAPLPASDGSGGVSRIRWQGFSPTTRGLFGRALERSYEGSLDMPELGGLRSLEDVLLGHQARGTFEPSRWQVGLIGDDPDPAAVLLLSEGEGKTWEVSYLGLAPEARGKGLGRCILARALELARPLADRLELAVDARNIPADRLYRRCGFAGFDRRRVHLAVLGGGRPSPGR